MESKYAPARTLAAFASAGIVVAVVLAVILKQPRSLLTKPLIPAVPNAPVADAEWKRYEDAKLGIGFSHPPGWPAPSSGPGGKYGSGGYHIAPESTWKLEVGPISKGACEGADCRLLSFQGFAPQDADRVAKQLLRNDMIALKSDGSIHGRHVITYSEGGICNDLAAVIFGHDQTVTFNSHCGDDSAEGRALFDRIMESFSIESAK